MQKSLQAAAAAADAKAQETLPVQAAEPVVTAAVPSSSVAEAEDPEVTAALDVATVEAALQEMEAPAQAGDLQAGDLQAGDPQAAPPALSAAEPEPPRKLRSSSRSQSPVRAQEGRAVSESGKDMTERLTVPPSWKLNLSLSQLSSQAQLPSLQGLATRSTQEPSAGRYDAHS